MFKFGQPIKLWTGEIVLHITSTPIKTRIMKRGGRVEFIPTFKDSNDESVFKERNYQPVEDYKLDSVIVPKYVNEPLFHYDAISDILMREMIEMIEKCIERQVEGEIG